MSNNLQGVYVITDDVLTPDETLIYQLESALRGGASIVQLRDKQNDIDLVKEKAKFIQKLCESYNALFILNDYIDMAIELNTHGLHIGKTDHDKFDTIRKDYKGIIGVSCYGDVDKAKDFQDRGADYVAFGSFYKSPTKPNANIIDLQVLEDAKKKLDVPVCAIGGINILNVKKILAKKPDMISIISDIWNSPSVEEKVFYYKTKFEENNDNN